MNQRHRDHFSALFDRIQNLDMGEAPLKAIDLSLPQIALLQCVARNPGKHAQDVVEEMGLTAPTVSVGLRRLEEEGWLRREPDPEDGRAMRHFPTQQALNVMQSMQRFRRQKMDQFLAALTEKEQAQLIGLLEKAINHLENKSES